MSKFFFYFYVVGHWQTEYLVPCRKWPSEFSDGGLRLGRDGGLVLSTSPANSITSNLFDLIRFRHRRWTTSSRTNGGSSHLILFFVLR